MRCGVCHAPLTVRGYRDVAVSRGTRRVPLYRPCPNLDDPASHQARRSGGATTRKIVVVSGASTLEAPTSMPSVAPFPRGSRLRFMGAGPFAARLAAGTEVVVRSTSGTRSIFEGDGLVGAIWPEHVAHWQVSGPAPSRGVLNVNTRRVK